MKLKPFLATLLAIAVAAPVLTWAVPDAAFEGRPEFGPASASGAFVWKDASWYNVRFTSELGPVRYHGTVCVKDRIHSVSTVILEEGDSVSVDYDGHCLNFSFLNNRHIDGFKFRTKSTRIDFDFNVNTDKLRPDQIWIGQQGVHPDDVPFALVPQRKTKPRRSTRAQ